MVGHEEGVEFAPLQGLREAGDMAKVEIGVREGARITPPGGVYADRTHERAQPQTSPFGHCTAPTLFSPRVSP